MTDKIRDFRDLRVWQAAMNLAVRVYALIRSFPAQETYGLSAQLRRAVISVPSNIAEGYRRESTKEYLQHLSIAQASLAEVALRLGYSNAADVKKLIELCASVGKQLYALRNSLRVKMNLRPPTPDP